jgi:hypothetical protein
VAHFGHLVGGRRSRVVKRQGNVGATVRPTATPRSVLSLNPS